MACDLQLTKTFFKEEEEAELVGPIVDLLYILVTREELFFSFFQKNQHSIFLFNGKMDKETEGLTQRFLGLRFWSMFTSLNNTDFIQQSTVETTYLQYRLSIGDTFHMKQKSDPLVMLPI